MKPEAAPRPTESGYYWVKIAQRTNVGPPSFNWTWDEPVISDWEPVEYDARQQNYDELGSDEIGRWDSDWVVVVAWLPLTPPEEVK